MVCVSLNVGVDRIKTEDDQTKKTPTEILFILPTPGGSSPDGNLYFLLSTIHIVRKNRTVVVSSSCVLDLGGSPPSSSLKDKEGLVRQVSCVVIPVC